MAFIRYYGRLFGPPNNIKRFCRGFRKLPVKEHGNRTVIAWVNGKFGSVGQGLINQLKECVLVSTDFEICGKYVTLYFRLLDRYDRYFSMKYDIKIKVVCNCKYCFIC